jgi:hypothetical protein
MLTTAHDSSQTTRISVATDGQHANHPHRKGRGDVRGGLHGAWLGTDTAALAMALLYLLHAWLSESVREGAQDQ